MSGLNLEIVLWIQSFRQPLIDVFFLFVTEFGDETIFLFLAALLYWTIDKKFAYRFMMFFLFGAVLNGSLKFLTNSPRPHSEFPDQVSLVGEGSGGTSLPSGHAQNSSMMAFTLHKKVKPHQWLLKGLLFIGVFLVMLSRLYLGEHYLSDVLLGLFVSYALYAFINRMDPRWLSNRLMQWLFVIMPFGLAILTQSKDMFVSSATILGIFIFFPLEEKYIGFKPKGSLVQSLIRMTIGVSVALILRVVIKLIFEQGLYSVGFESNPTLTDNLLDFIRYFIIVIWMMIIAPFIFKKLERK
jgi:undecaprenyl-diphosphatase